MSKFKEKYTKIMEGFDTTPDPENLGPAGQEFVNIIVNTVLAKLADLDDQIGEKIANQYSKEYAALEQEIGADEAADFVSAITAKIESKVSEILDFI